MDDVPGRFASVGQRLKEIQGRISALHGRLALGPDEASEAELATLLRQRDAYLHSWALLAHAWQTGGGRVRLEPPEVTEDDDWHSPGEAILAPPEPRHDDDPDAPIPLRPSRRLGIAGEAVLGVHEDELRPGTARPASTPAERGPAERGPADRGPAERGPADRIPADRGPTDRGPTDRGPADRGPAERGPADRSPPGPTDRGLTDPNRATPGEMARDDSLDLSILDSFVVNPSWTHQVHGLATVDLQSTHEMAARLGPPAARDTDEDRLAEAAALDRELQRLALWTEYPRGLQRALVGLFACRLRYLQEESPSHVRSILERQIRKDFARLTQFSSDHQPGWVTGLSRQHKPETGTWLGDAEFWWKTLKRELGGFLPEADRTSTNPEVALNALQAIMNEPHPDPQLIRSVATRALNAGVQPEDPRIVRMLIGHLDALAGDKALKRLRRAVRRVETGEDEDEEPVTQQDILPPDWPYLSRTRGHAAVMVGGEVREQRRAFIQDALGFASLEWISGYDIRQVQNLAERIESGRVGFVILLARFISHKITDILLPTCRAAEVDWVVVKQGYGLSQIRVAIERYLDDPQKAAAEDEEADED